MLCALGSAVRWLATDHRRPGLRDRSSATRRCGDTHPMKPLLLAFALLFAAAPSLARDDVPFAELGKGFLKARFKSEAAGDCPMQKLREQHCAHGLIGIFDIAYPAWQLSEKQHVEDLRALCNALLSVQGHWIDWLAKGDDAAAPAKADVEALLLWVKGWKPAALSKVEAAADKDLFLLLGANEAQSAAAKRLTTFLSKPDVLAVAPRNGEPTHLLFAPARRDFVEMLGYAGLLDPAQPAVLWNAEATTWTSFWIGWDLVLALEYPPWSEDKEFKTGLSMNKFEPTGMLEHVVQQSMLALLWSCYGDSDALYLHQAQAMNMAIEVCGEINALEGDGGRGTTGAKTQPYEKFVPGGSSSGGTLPPIPAATQDSMKTNQWHEGLGKDHFAAPLRKGQKNAQKQLTKDKPIGLDPSVAKDKHAHFLLISPDQQVKYVVSAPFLGKYSKDKAYPPHEVIADYREFFRAFKCGFYYWLQSQADKGGAEGSAIKYKDLMKKLAARDPAAKSFEDLVVEVYGVPLSGKNGETDCLEWRFLEWLGKGK